MLSKKKSADINLLPIDLFSTSILGKILKWLLSTFRYIVILVELVVMAAFLSRFWLDAKNSDLNDEMKQKQALIQASKNFEDEFNKINEKISIAKAINTNSDYITLPLTEVAPLMPPELSLTSITTTPDSISLAGTSPSTTFLAQLMAGLAANKKLEKAVLTQIQSSEKDGFIDFRISIPLKTDSKNIKK